MNSLCERELNNKPISLWNELLVMGMGLRVGGGVRSGLGVDGGGYSISYSICMLILVTFIAEELYVNVNGTALYICLDTKQTKLLY